VNIYIFDYEKIEEGGFYQGYNFIVIIIVFLSAIGGLLIALVIAYANNIVKGYATSISIVISTFLSSYLLNDLDINQYIFFILFFYFQNIRNKYFYD
jgi:UDP-sugar transporter A1/2/3